MLDPDLENVLVRQTEISYALAKISADLAELTTFLKTYHEMQPGAGNAALEPATEIPPPVTVSDPKQEALKSVYAARTVVAALNRPMMLKTLYEHIASMGFQINTADPSRTYAIRLRDYKARVGLVYLSGFGWWVRDRPYPPANYPLPPISNTGEPM